MTDAGAPPPAATPAPRAGRTSPTASYSRPWLARLWALALLLLGLLPIANWIDGGHEAPWFDSVLQEWVSGTAIGVGAAVVLFLVLRRLDVWPAGLVRLAEAASRRPRRTAGALAGLSLVLYVVIARTVFSGRPLLIDEMVQVMQARIFAGGAASLPASQHPAFFSALHVVDVTGRVFSQFPPGGPLMLVPGILAGVPWLTGPVCGALAVAVFWFLVRRTESTPGAALGAVVLFGAAPFMAFMAGSHMNHVPSLMWLCVALLALSRVTAAEHGGLPGALLAGFAFGMMAAIRPVDGAAFALPAGAWLLARTVRGRLPVAALLAAGAGVAVPVAGVLAYNAATTGDPLLFGYELLWGPSHGLGFHRAPWGITHTPGRGMELINLYFLRLQTYLFETPLPSLVPAALALLLAKSLSALDRYLLASSALLVVGYFAYWHDGFYLGPRFLYLLMPVLALWTARLPGLLAARSTSPWGASRIASLAYLASAVVALWVSIPVRARQYAGGLSSMRHDYTAPAARAGVRGALILVRESWGAQLIARMWGLGVSRSETEGIYRTVDTCLLEGAVSRLESSGITGDAALAALLPLTRDSLRLASSTLSPDQTERVLPGTAYGETCRRRILEDRAGYAFLAPVLARDPATNVYARDLHASDTLLLAQYPGRAAYLLRAASSAVGAPLVLEPLNTDSARADWGVGGRER